MSFVSEVLLLSSGVVELKKDYLFDLLQAYILVMVACKELTTKR